MWTEERLNELLTTPSKALIEDAAKIKGDFVIVGAGGKMGPTLCVLIKNACKAAGVEKKVTAVSLFDDRFSVDLLKANGVEIINTDLMADGAFNSLPDAENVIYMAGRKFGTDGQECLTWAMNAWLPSLTAGKYKNSNIVVFSSGNIYPFLEPGEGGSDEDSPLEPVGEYAMSCLARERIFEYASKVNGTKVCIFRLNYAVDLRYGVLYDIARQILDGTPIRISTPVFNCVWQGSANEAAVRCLLHCESPRNILNVTGPETASVKKTALELGKYLGKEPAFEECAEEAKNSKALINSAGKFFDLFGYPQVSLQTLIRWQAEWLLGGGRVLDKPTHFEERKGKF